MDAKAGETIKPSDGVEIFFECLPYPLRVTFGVILFAIIISSLKNRLLIFEFLLISKQRGINILFMFEQTSQLFFIGTVAIYTFALMSPVSLSQTFGNDFCKWLRIPSGVYVCGVPVWSCSVATYRLTFLKTKGGLIKNVGQNKLIIGFVALAMTIQAICSYLLIWFDHASFITRICLHGKMFLNEVMKKLDWYQQLQIYVNLHLVVTSPCN